MLEVLARSFQGRSVRWTVDNSRIETPCALFLPGMSSFLELAEGFIQIGDIHSPSAIIAKNGAKMAEMPGSVQIPVSLESQMMVLEEESDGDGALATSEEVVVLEHSFEMRRDARLFVRKLSALRESAGPGKLVYAPGIMDVSNIALLAYMGVDLFDTSLLIYQARKGLMTLPEGTIAASSAQWLVGMDSARGLEDINLDLAMRELGLVRHLIRNGRLRELAEVRANSTPWGVAALRLFDLECYSLQESQAPVVGPRFYANSAQSLDRPDVVRWRRRVEERWQPSSHKKVLLLLPCSAKKPYFVSKSHQLFREALMRVPNHDVVQELIITSPLGAVPRELELFYPAAQYDIPVTGHWGSDEQRMVRELVSSAASKGFERVVSHLGHGNDFVKDSVDCLDTSEGSPTSRESLARLEVALTKICQEYDRLAKGADRAASLGSVARFQFGAGGEALAEGCTVIGNYPYSKIFSGKEQMGMLTPERGMISLTLQGASRLLPRRLHCVEMEDFELSGNLFAVGIKAADPQIRVGDEALVLRNGELVAVGISAMNAREMVELKRGEAVKIRHKRKSA